MENKLLLIGLMAVSNALTRLLPVGVLCGRTLPPLFVQWLKFIPVPVLSAMLACDLFFREGHWDISTSNLALYASIPTFFVAFRTKNLFITVLFGMLTLAAVRFLTEA